MNTNLKIVRMKGSEIIPYISDLAKLRMEIFKSYPYLYDGSFDYETEYLKTYTTCPESIMVLVFEQDKVVGVSTAIPLELEIMEFQKPFIDNNYNIKDIFLFGESLLLPAYRGRNIYHHFFKEREDAARIYGCKLATFFAVERPIDDPRKPSDYVPLDKIWNRFGYKKHPEINLYIEWKEVDEETQSPKPVIFWLKKL